MNNKLKKMFFLLPSALMLFNSSSFAYNILVTASQRVEIQMWNYDDKFRFSLPTQPTYRFDLNPMPGEKKSKLISSPSCIRKLRVIVGVNIVKADLNFGTVQEYVGPGKIYPEIGAPWILVGGVCNNISIDENYRVEKE